MNWLFCLLGLHDKYADTTALDQGLPIFVCKHCKRVWVQTAIQAVAEEKK